MIIQITEEHIKNADRINAYKCPLMLAFNEKKNDFAIGTNCFQIHAPSPMLVVVKLPKEVSDFILDWDMGRPVNPIDVLVSAECFMN